VSSSASAHPSWWYGARCHDEATLNLMVLKTQPERIATIRRMVALPGSGLRQDQVAAIARAFEKLLAQ